MSHVFIACRAMDTIERLNNFRVLQFTGEYKDNKYGFGFSCMCLTSFNVGGCVHCAEMCVTLGEDSSLLISL